MFTVSTAPSRISATTPIGKFAALQGTGIEFGRKESTLVVAMFRRPEPRRRGRPAGRPCDRRGGAACPRRLLHVTIRNAAVTRGPGHITRGLQRARDSWL